MKHVDQRVSKQKTTKLRVHAEMSLRVMISAWLTVEKCWDSSSNQRKQAV